MKETNQIFSYSFLPSCTLLFICCTICNKIQGGNIRRMIDLGSISKNIEGRRKKRKKRSPSLFGRCHHHHVTPCSGIYIYIENVGQEGGRRGMLLGGTHFVLAWPPPLISTESNIIYQALILLYVHTRTYFQFLLSHFIPLYSKFLFFFFFLRRGKIRKNLRRDASSFLYYV